MKAKLVKHESKHESGYILFDEKGIPIGAIPNVLSNGTFSKLSFKNCQAIERGYDLDELLNDYIMRRPFMRIDKKHQNMYKEGFQKALELMGDKKFSEENMFRMFTYGHALTNAIKLKAIEDKPFGEIFNDFIQSLQQTEWEVTYNLEELDADGCLILKRI